MHILYNTRSFLVNFSKSITKDRSCVRQQKLGARAGMLPHRKQSISLPLQRISVQKSANTYIKLLSLSRVNKKLFQTRESAIHLKKNNSNPDSTNPTHRNQLKIRRDFISSSKEKNRKKKYCEQFAAYTKTQFHNHLRQKLWNNYSNHGG